jgi:hypothetical protein
MTRRVADPRVASIADGKRLCQSPVTEVSLIGGPPSPKVSVDPDRRVKVVGIFTNTDLLLRLFTSVIQGQRDPWRERRRHFRVGTDWVANSPNDRHGPLPAAG